MDVFPDSLNLKLLWPQFWVPRTEKDQNDITNGVKVQWVSFLYIDDILQDNIDSYWTANWEAAVRRKKRQGH